MSKDATERKVNQPEPDQVKVGDLMAFVYYVKVDRVTGGGVRLDVLDVDNNNSPLQITGKDLVKRSFSADQHHETEKVSKTHAAELLVSSVNRPFTVCFEKADGTERVLRGRLVKPEPLLGRSMVEDLDSTDSHRLRQVDHRTIKWLVVEGVRYEVK